LIEILMEIERQNLRRCSRLEVPGAVPLGVSNPSALRLCGLKIAGARPNWIDRVIWRDGDPPIEPIQLLGANERLGDDREVLGSRI
jgi:hypothetical protein